jgi:16S rRNA A1518/A1519 N6-dimethyltransferase RsmA/KsgA/DIM1 with predicted DNA glycosylase/AP lyase activity
MLRQSLKNLCPDAEASIRAAGIDATMRAENLSVADFASLARAVHQF